MNDQQRAAMQMALETIETLWDIIDDIDTYGDMAKADEKLYRSLVDRKQRERFKTGITTDGYTLNDGAITALREALAQPQGEPVAWRWETHNGHAYSEEHYEGEGGEPLYTTPPSVEAAIDWSNLKFQYHALQQIGGYWYDGPVRNQWIADNCHEMTKHIAAAIRSMK